MPIDLPCRQPQRDLRASAITDRHNDQSKSNANKSKVAAESATLKWQWR